MDMYLFVIRSAKEGKRRIHNKYAAKGPEVINGEKVFAKDFVGKVFFLLVCKMLFLISF